MSLAGRKVTIRMPDHDGPGKAEVVGIHVDPGGSVRESYPVMTVITMLGEQRIRAPRAGTVLPIVSVGDEVGGGDALFVLSLDESALSSEKSKSRPSALRQKAPSPLRISEDAAPDPAAAMAAPTPPVRLRPARVDRTPVQDDEHEERADWLKPALATAVYLIASFLLFPVFLQVGVAASPVELAALAGMAAAIVCLVVTFLMPAHGAWPRRIVRVLSLGWLMLLAYPLYPALMNPPVPAAIALEEPATGGATGDERSPER